MPMLAVVCVISHYCMHVTAQAAAQFREDSAKTFASNSRRTRLTRSMEGPGALNPFGQVQSSPHYCLPVDVSILQDLCWAWTMDFNKLLKITWLRMKRRASTIWCLWTATSSVLTTFRSTLPELWWLWNCELLYLCVPCICCIYYTLSELWTAMAQAWEESAKLGHYGRWCKR